MTDRQGRQTHHYMLSSPFSVTHWDGSVLSSCAGAAGLLPAFSQLPVSHPGRSAGLSENTHKSHQWQRGRACTFPVPHSLTFTEMNLLALSGSRCQVPPQQRQKKNTSGLKISKNRRVLFFFKHHFHEWIIHSVVVISAFIRKPSTHKHGDFSWLLLASQH